MLGSAPTLRCPHGSPGRGRPYRGGTDRRGPFPQSPPPTAPSAAGRWGCVRGRAGRCHGSRLGGEHLQARKRPWSKVWGASRTPPRLRHLPAAGPGKHWRRRRGRNGRSSSVAMTAGTSQVQGRMGGARPMLQTSLATEHQRGQKCSVPATLSRAFSGARTGKGPIAKYEEETQTTCLPPTLPM